MPPAKKQGIKKTPRAPSKDPRQGTGSLGTVESWDNAEVKELTFKQARYRPLSWLEPASIR